MDFYTELKRGVLKLFTLMLLSANYTNKLIVVVYHDPDVDSKFPRISCFMSTVTQDVRALTRGIRATLYCDISFASMSLA